MPRARQATAQEAEVRCPIHGEDCDYNLTDHPLPPQGRDALQARWRDDDDPDPDGFEADMAAERMYDR